MHLRRLEIRDVRILREVRLEPAPGANLFVGPNGSGKTSLLEAIHLLAVGRSLRAQPGREAIARGAERLSVFGEVVNEAGESQSLGVEKGRRETRLRLSGEWVRAASKLARVLPVVVMNPDSQRLLTDGADLRRRVMDWALFHVEPGYLEVLQGYRRALRQRNAVLRAGGRGESLRAWDRELGALGERVEAFRGRYMEGLLAEVERGLEELLEQPLVVTYEPGWEVERGLEAVLAESTPRERELGYTLHGPHRADLGFRVAGGGAARYVLSRGEAKLFVGAVVVGQLRYVARQTGRVPVALVDDLASELDGTSRQRLMGALEVSGAQVFVTALAPELLRPWPADQALLFHVEQGRVFQVV